MADLIVDGSPTDPLVGGLCSYGNPRVDDGDDDDLMQFYPICDDDDYRPNAYVVCG